MALVDDIIFSWHISHSNVFSQYLIKNSTSKFLCVWMKCQRHRKPAISTTRCWPSTQGAPVHFRSVSFNQFIRKDLFLFCFSTFARQSAFIVVVLFCLVLIVHCYICWPRSTLLRIDLGRAYGSLGYCWSPLLCEKFIFSYNIPFVLVVDNRNRGNGEQWEEGTTIS